MASGVELLQAWFAGAGYARHRHDTYAIGVTDAGVQSFWYRGAVHSSTPGEVVVLHPDELHDGYAGTAQGFGYRIAYVEPAHVLEAARAITGRPCALPFVRTPVIRSPRIRKALDDAFDGESADALVVELAHGLLATAAPVEERLVDEAAVERARQFLDSIHNRIVSSAELEAVSGLSRYELARQFRARTGTSPYRYSVMRRLARARERLGRLRIADVALDAGFADQAHFSRAFKAAFGMTPAKHLAATQ